MMEDEYKCLSLCNPCSWTTASFRETLVCVFGLEIRVYLYGTERQLIRVLRGHKSKIISVNVNPHNHLQLLSIDQGGRVLFWDVFAGQCVEEHQISLSSVKFAHISSSGLVAAEVDEKKATVLVFPWSNGSLKTKKPIRTISTPFFHVLNEKAFAVGCEDRSLAIVTGDLSVSVYNLLEEEEPYRVFLSRRALIRRRIEVTAVALHPSQPHLAVGLSSGEIVLWRAAGASWPRPRKRPRPGDSSPSSAPAVARVHWHSLAVLCLAFLAGGDFLLSGGHEAVLVQWDLTERAAASQRRRLLPRLAAPLLAVGGAGPGLAFVLLANRSLLLLRPAAGFTTALAVEGRQLRGGPPGAVGATAGSCPRHLPPLVLDPLMDRAVAGARPGHLQWLGCGLRLDVAGENYVALPPPPGAARPGRPEASAATEVTQVVAAPDGALLVTAEATPLGDSGRWLRRLRWWRRAEETEWRLAFCANVSHHGALGGLALAPGAVELIAVAGGELLLFSQVRPGPDECWRERAVWRVGRGERPGPTLVAVWPYPGPPLLAAAAGAAVDLWRWRPRPLSAEPALVERLEAPALAQLAWAGPGGPLVGRAVAGEVLAWRCRIQGGGEAEPRVCGLEETWRRALGATALAAPPGGGRPWVTVCTSERRCLLLDAATGQELCSMEMRLQVCCAVVTEAGLLLGLGCEEEDMVRLRISEEGIEEEEEESECNSLVRPARPSGGLLRKLEALAKPMNGGISITDSKLQLRVTEQAEERIKEQLDELIHCPANCCPNLEQMAATILELQAGVMCNYKV